MAQQTTKKKIRQALSIVSDTKCHLKFGAAPTATVSNKLVAASAVEYFGVIEGQKVSAINAV